MEAPIFLAVLLLVAFAIDRIRRKVRTRKCPRCGYPVWRGDLDCRECGFDFRTIGT